MIEVRNISKSFDDNIALDNISCDIADGSIFGIVGSNGAGKSTFLRILSGVYDINQGSILYDGEKLNNKMNNVPDILFLSDDMFFEPADTINSLAKRYKAIYEKFDYEKFEDLLKAYGLRKSEKMAKMSKGMRKQAFLSIALASNAKYLMLDETLDGLDPIMRINTKKLIFDEMSLRDMITVITSHSLKELEDMCDTLSMLHEGKIVIQGSIDDFKSSVVKIRCAFNNIVTKEAFKDIDIENLHISGKICTVIIKGSEEDAKTVLNKMNPLLVEILPVTVEELFVIKLNQMGYGSNMEWGIYK